MITQNARRTVSCWLPTHTSPLPCISHARGACHSVHLGDGGLGVVAAVAHADHRVGLAKHAVHEGGATVDEYPSPAAAVWPHDQFRIGEIVERCGRDTSRVVKVWGWKQAWGGGEESRRSMRDSSNNSHVSQARWGSRRERVPPGITSGPEWLRWGLLEGRVGDLSRFELVGVVLVSPPVVRRLGRGATR